MTLSVIYTEQVEEPDGLKSLSVLYPSFTVLSLVDIWYTGLLAYGLLLNNSNNNNLNNSNIRDLH